ncbi:nuclear transport factor 2 family protein [Pleurocapsales cyanobacterium LEGE 10410]|nr:nuclear transport factor 2 family protein [Pleurocapsales cyanobacterium LEGE 10410]
MKRFTTALLLNLGIITGWANLSRAESVATAPEELTEIVESIEQAANDKNIEEVLEYYSQDFTHTDGLNVDTLAKALTQMWKTYPRLKYNTEIESWSEQGGQLVAETKTTVRGVQNNNGRIVRLNSTIRSRQYFEQQKLVRQEILSEQSRLTSGENPPQVQISAPTTVTTGQRYNFDLIVNQPLGDRVLLGGVQENKTASNLYLNPPALELEPLPAGGIYKTAIAPLLPDSNWLSAILVRGDGITMIAHRVNVEEKPAPAKK